MVSRERVIAREGMVSSRSRVVTREGMIARIRSKGSITRDRVVSRIGTVARDGREGRARRRSFVFGSDLVQRDTNRSTTSTVRSSLMHKTDGRNLLGVSSDGSGIQLGLSIQFVHSNNRDGSRSSHILRLKKIMFVSTKKLWANRTARKSIDILR